MIWKSSIIGRCLKQKILTFFAVCLPISYRKGSFFLFSLTEITGAQRSSSDQDIQVVEVQPSSDSEIRVPVRVDRVNLNDGERIRLVH